MIIMTLQLFKYPISIIKSRMFKQVPSVDDCGDMFVLFECDSNANHSFV